MTVTFLLFDCPLHNPRPEQTVSALQQKKHLIASKRIRGFTQKFKSFMWHK